MIPFARPFASESEPALSQASGQGRPGKANDSLPNATGKEAAPRRLTPARVAELRRSLSDRDLAIMATVCTLNLVTAGQIERIHFVGTSRQSNARRCRDALARLTALRVLARLDRRIGGVRPGSSSFVYVLDVAGLHLSPTPRRPQRPALPSMPFVSHAVAVSEVYVRLVEAERSGELELLGFQAEPACWREHAGPGGGRSVLKPDAFCRIGKGEFELGFFLEIDRATESVPALRRKLTRYRAHLASGREQARLGYFPRVAWVVPSKARKSTLGEVIAAEPEGARALHAVCLDAEVVRTFTGEVAS